MIQKPDFKTRVADNSMPIMSLFALLINLIPPHILVLLAYKQYIVIHLCRYQVIKVFQEWTDVLDVCMSTIAWNRTDFKIGLM